MKSIREEPKYGDRFGKLTYIKRDFDEERKLRFEHEKRFGKMRWAPHKQGACVCDCGNTKSVPINRLKSGAVKPCGCLRSEDLTGKQFGFLNVLSLDPMSKSGKNHHKTYLCQCHKCGRIVSRRSSDLKSGATIDCGCGHQERMSKAQLHDLSGMQFGHLHVIERSYSVGYASGQGIHSHWLCLCDLCNRVTTVNSWSLTGRGKDRCDECLKQEHHSSGELKIMELLDSNNVKYECEYRPDGCVFPDTNSQLRFDFLVHSVVPFFIEYDGVQHFRPVGKWDEHIDYDGRVARDEFKNQWCAKNKYKLIRIPYTHFNDLCIEDLFPETSAFCVTF